MEKSGRTCLAKLDRARATLRLKSENPLNLDAQGMVSLALDPISSKETLLDASYAAIEGQVAPEAIGLVLRHPAADSELHEAIADKLVEAYVDTAHLPELEIREGAIAEIRSPEYERQVQFLMAVVRESNSPLLLSALYEKCMRYEQPSPAGLSGIELRQHLSYDLSPTFDNLFETALQENSPQLPDYHRLCLPHQPAHEHSKYRSAVLFNCCNEKLLADVLQKEPPYFKESVFTSIPSTLEGLKTLVSGLEKKHWYVFNKLALKKLDECFFTDFFAAVHRNLRDGVITESELGQNYRYLYNAAKEAGLEPSGITGRPEIRRLLVKAAETNICLAVREDAHCL